MWETEKDFGISLKKKLKFQGLNCIRIESASTVSGMPDMFVEGGGDDYFIELKNMKSDVLKKKDLKIEWRKGQQAWASTYARTHRKRVLGCFNHCFIKCSWTFIGIPEGVICIRMDKLREGNVIENFKSDSSVFIFDRSEWSSLNVLEFLRRQTYILSPDTMAWCDSILKYVYTTVQTYSEQLFNQSIPWDNEVVFDDALYRLQSNKDIYDTFTGQIDSLTVNDNAGYDELAFEDFWRHVSNELRNITYEYCKQFKEQDKLPVTEAK